MVKPSIQPGSLAIRQLGELYREVERLVPAARAGQLDAAAVRERVLALVTRQGQAAAKRGEAYVSENDQPARFLMVAFADEILGHLDWPGREAWRAHPLARELFGEEHADRVVFERIDQLLAHPSERRQELARVYLLALCLGFVGHHPNPEAIARTRRRLFTLIFGREPRSAVGLERLTPEAYQHTASWGDRQLLPAVRRWVLAVVVAALLLLLVSVPLWWHAVADLSQAVEQALAVSE